MSNYGITRRCLVAGAMMLTASIGFSSGASAQDVSFEGKTVDFVNFGGPGSPPDVWMRTLAPFLEKHLAGNPKINVINKPGASSMISANYTAQALKNDGYAIGTMNAVAMNKAASGDPSAKFDLKTLEVVGAQKLTRIVAVKKEGIQSIDDLIGSDIELIVGMESDATPFFDAFFELTGINGKIISSYDRFPNTLQAFRTGEVDAMPMSVIEWLTFGPDLSKDGAVALIQYGFGEDGKVTSTDAIDAPTGNAVAEKVNPDSVGSDAWNVMLVQASGQTVSNQVWAPEGTPKEFVNAYSAAFVAATSDPEFMALHEKQYGLPVEWTDAAKARSVVDGVLAVYGK